MPTKCHQTLKQKPALIVLAVPNKIVLLKFLVTELLRVNDIT